jgi:hypothetical protein
MLINFKCRDLPRGIKSLTAIGLIAYGPCLLADDQPAQPLTIDAGSFRCIRQMTSVRHFYVDNLTGKIDATLAAANAKSGAIYPPGSVVQLVPTEAMVKREKGFNPATGDWEFFDLDVSENATRIRARGFAEVNNRFGKNCFACHVPARDPWDFICESDHGCDSIPIDHTMTGALQRSDPRCGPEVPHAGDHWALWKLRAIVFAAWLKGLF